MEIKKIDENKNILQSRIVYSLLIIAIIITGIIIVGRLNNSNDMYPLEGDFAGSVTLENEPLYPMNLQFTKQGVVSGTVSIDSEEFNVDSEYVMIGNSISFKITLDSNRTLYFSGEISPNYGVINGNTTMEINDTIINGTFYISK